MKTFLWLLFFVAVMIYSSKPIITLKPFSLVFESPYTPFAILFLVISISLFNIQSRKDLRKELIQEYYRAGLKDGSEQMIELLNDELKKQGKDAKVTIVDGNGS
jgi:hypothetical protein